MVNNDSFLRYISLFVHQMQVINAIFEVLGVYFWTNQIRYLFYKSAFLRKQLYFS